MKFKTKTLKNGLRIVTVPMAENPSVTMLVMVRTGSKYESKERNGISHFLEHMAFKGTKNRPNASDISRELDQIGAHYNAFTGQEYTGYYVKADKKHVSKIIDILSDMYKNPVLDEKEIEKEKGVIVEEIRMYNDLPQRKVASEFMSLLYGDQPAGWDIAGTEDLVRSFRRQDFVDYYNSQYTLPNTTVIISGSFGEKALRDIEKTFKDGSSNKAKTKLPVKESQDGPQIGLSFKETDQTHLIIGFRAFSINDKRIPIMSVLVGILSGGMSSRLFKKLRDDMGICYYVRADNDAYTDHGVLAISAGLDNSRVEEGIKAILGECQRLVNESVADDELEKVKEYIAGTTMLGLETSDSRAEYCGFLDALKGEIDTPEEYIKKIRKITSKDIQKLAKEIFTNDKLNMAIVGKYKDPEPFKKYLKVV
jgi:predicted Zn-dependent peptidase